LNHRFSSGFLLRGVYTFSKALDDGDSLNATTSGGGPALASNPFDLHADKGLATYDVRHIAAINATYALSVRTRTEVCERTFWICRRDGEWMGRELDHHGAGRLSVSPQLSYNPSNNGDTRNPVRPFANANFSGPVILGTPDKWFDPAAFLAPSNAVANAGFLRELGTEYAAWARPCDVGFFHAEKYPAGGADEFAIPRRDFQFAESCEILICRMKWCSHRPEFRPLRRDYEHNDDIAAGAVRAKTALVTD